jgi:hypothetical protein
VTERSVPRAVTEEAVYYLYATYTEYDRASLALPAPKGRVRTNAAALGTFEPATVVREACLFRLVCVVEAYVDTVSSALFRERAPTSRDLVRRLVERAELRASATWDERVFAFETYHRVSLGQLARWSELNGAIEARNAIAHGLGRLTPRQRNPAVAGRLGQIGVAVRDGAIVVSDVSLEQCLQACVEFIRSVDAATRPTSHVQ